MSCCHASIALPKNPQWIEHVIAEQEHEIRNARITAIALGFIALFLFTVGCILFGVGTLSPTLMKGLGVIPYLGGVFLSYIALGVLCGMFVYAAIAGVRTCQKSDWQAIIK